MVNNQNAITCGPGTDLGNSIDVIDCIVDTVLYDTSCASYTSPSGLLWTSSGTYYDTISSANGCDSAITMHLTVNRLITSIRDTSCVSYISQSGKI